MRLAVIPGRHRDAPSHPPPHAQVRNADMDTTARRRRALVVEDEGPIRELLELHLTIAGYDVTACRDGHAAIAHLRATRFDVVLLDLMLPGIDGLALCRAARLDGPNTDSGILILTARHAETDKVLGLQSGADDYVTKPFGVHELLARIDAILRRAARSAPALAPEAPAQDRLVAADDIVLDLDRRYATSCGRAVDLTRQEFDVLHLLVSRRGVVFSRAALLAHAWPRDVTVTGRTVDTVISRLRHKIERHPESPALVVTVWGVGYKFADGD